MAKLYFRYGTMGSAKTLNLLAVAHNYQSQNKTVYVIKPKLDVRFEPDSVVSRAGLSKKADLLVTPEMTISDHVPKTVNCVLVDEVQFLTDAQIENLRYLSTHYRIPVIAYGLRSNYKGYLFPPIKRLMALADAIEEVKTTCHFCQKKAIMNLRMKDGQGVLSGQSIDLGAEDKYVPACYTCFDAHTRV